MRRTLLYFVLFSAIFQSCTAPRNVIESGRVTPKGHVRSGFGSTTNIPTAFPAQVIKTLSNGIGDAIQDTFVVNENIENVTSSILSYALDPLTQTFDFYFRFGLFNNFDLGYKYTGGLHAFDVQYQLAGLEEHNHMQWGNISSSIGLQYSGKQYKLPDWVGDLQETLGFRLGRKDLFAKWINSIPFGENEQYGHFGFGLAYNHTFVNYGLNPTKIVVKIEEEAGQEVTEVLDYIPNQKKNFGSYGIFASVRGGYKYVFLYAAFAVYWQDYGKYSLFEGHSYHGKGFTFIPTFGLQVDI